MQANPIPGNGGDTYVPYDQRTGEESTVFFTRDLSAEGLNKVFAHVADRVSGKIAVKVHTGEKDGPNIIPREWVADLFAKQLPDATIVETNTAYEGDRFTTAQHLETVAHNGWTFAPVDILDAEANAFLPVEGGKWFDCMSVGANLLNYDSLVALTHFKGHVAGGFGGSNKNIGIGCADGRLGKIWIHTRTGSTDRWGIKEEEFMERIVESTKSVVDHFGDKVVYVNVMRNMSVSCDCEGLKAQPVVTPNVGILASTDLLAIDQACVDLVYAMRDEDNHDLVERMETRHGLRQLTYMKELHMGNDRYQLIDTDNDDVVITPAQGVEHVVPFEG
ncbi:MAG: DUF362 domain-containing protein [Eggerthellales bacterium]|nr:DUF362 domain-containing protein [Eggerthellales bacterium]